MDRNCKGRFKKGRANRNKILPVIGKLYGELTVISEELQYDSGGRSKWKMECKCGNVQWISAKTLRRSVKPRVLCTPCSVALSHSKRDNNSYGKGRSNHSGSGDITLTHYHDIKASMRNRSKYFDVNELPPVEYLWDLFLKQNKVCKLTGEPLSFGGPLIREGNNSRVKYKEKTASLDRIDSSIGYAEGNLQWLHKHINIMKSDHNQDYFIKLCRSVTEYDNPELSSSNTESATTIPEGSTLK